MIQLLRKYYGADRSTRLQLEQEREVLKARSIVMLKSIKESLQIVGEPKESRNHAGKSYGNFLRGLYTILTTSAANSLTKEQQSRLDTLYKDRDTKLDSLPKKSLITGI